MRIIIADDQKHARSGLRALLSASLAAPEIYEAGTGLEAERLAEEVNPHIILMDMRMPVMDGLAATRLIKARRPHIRIIVLSLQGSAARDAMAAGADDFVSKGESPQRLLGAVRALAPSEGIAQP